MLSNNAKTKDVQPITPRRKWFGLRKFLIGKSFQFDQFLSTLTIKHKEVVLMRQRFMKLDLAFNIENRKPAKIIKKKKGN
jgi:hypothetical protein